MEVRIEPLSKSKLDDLAASLPSRDEFGPDSDRPFLAINLTGTGDEHAKWVSDLPCPVIGIGNGGLSSACDVVLDSDQHLEMIVGNIKKAPLTAMVLVQHLRASEQLSLEDALVAESFAYATVQKGPDFLTWLAGYTPPADLQSASEQPLEIEIDGNTLALRFNDPATLNSIGIKMRDALSEALDLALANPDFSKITLTGKGRVFSTGGEIGEFGEVTDPATAHWVRSLRLPAWRMARLRDRLDIHVNGAAVGAGCEILGFASKITASPKAWFRLPELKYGLIPGAGGTASLPKRIGRQKTAFMALSMQKIRAQTALDWGLIDEIVS